MTHIYGLKNNKVKVLGLGVFDGIHKGHQSIAKKCDALLTLFPHPDCFLGKSNCLKMLSTLREQRYYFNRLLVLHFTKEISRLSAIAFLEEIVYKRIAPKEIVVGGDYQFGHKGEGDISLLRIWAKEKNIRVTIISECRLKDIPIRSSYIRELLNNDKFNDAVEMLGHSYLIIGKVVRGDGRGKTIGFPTSNLKVPSRKLVPKHGVYRGAVIFQRKIYRCLIYIGQKPTFNQTKEAIEVYIKGFSEEIYNRQLKVFIESKIRNDICFPDQGALVSQIKKDLIQIG